MKPQLEGLKWDSVWNTQMGCIKGCLSFLGAGVSTPWIYGATGSAFVINMHETVCPSGPTAWDTARVLELAENIGAKIESVFAHKQMPEFAEKQREAWDFVRAHIDSGHPCYGWELMIPQYYLINGCDDVGYYYIGCSAESIEGEGNEGPKPWQELGESEIGVLEVHSVEATDPSPLKRTVCEALEFAVKFAREPGDWVFPNYKSGAGAFDSWANALESGGAVEFGHVYNIQAWSECRKMAVDFLMESKARLDGESSALFDEAIACYGNVSSLLSRARDIQPFSPPTEETRASTLKCQESAALIREAGEAEEMGLALLDEIVRAL